MNKSENNNLKILIDALKYTSNIIVDLTNKLNDQENKIDKIENKINKIENLIIILKNENVESNSKINFNKNSNVNNFNSNFLKERQNLQRDKFQKM